MISSSFAPSEVEINSLGIGLIQSNVGLLDLNNREYLVVGEQGKTTDDTRDITYNLIVNNDIVGINTSRRRIDGIEEDSVKPGSLFVGNDIICDGNIIAKGLEFGNIKLDGYNADVLQDILVSVNNISPLIYKGYGVTKNKDVSEFNSIRTDNIYTPSFLTLGSKTNTYENTNPLKIVSKTNYNVNNVHISIENDSGTGMGESAKLRMGIVGDTSQSPAVISTTSGMPIAFHVGMSSDDVNKLYSSQTGDPNYEMFPEFIPSLAIDKNGNIGIGVTQTQINTYNNYFKVNDEVILQNEISKHSKIKILGGADIDNIITYDYYTKSKKHIDDIFVRKAGLNFTANQIVPGDFIQGLFKFNSNVYIGAEGDEYTLEVNDKINVNGDLNVSNHTNIQTLNVSGDAVFENTTKFNEKIHLENGAIVAGSLEINDGQFKIDDTRINILTLHSTIVNSDTTPLPDTSEPPTTIMFFANNDMINFSSGSNLVIPGKAGVGIKMNDTYDEQFNVVKRDPIEYEMMLGDKSQENEVSIYPVANIGHLNGMRDINYIPDKSLILNTNNIDGELHNMYFYPGVDIVRREVDSYVPTLTIHQNNRIGVNTKDPQKAIDINGDILCNDVFVRRNNGEITKSLFFVSKNFDGAQLGDVSNDFYYAYDTTGINKFAINLANSEGIEMKGLNVDGGIHSVGNGGYYENNIKLSMLKMINDNSSQSIAYTNEHLIIGHNNDNVDFSGKPLTIRNLADEDYNDSIIRIYRAPVRGIINRNAIYSGIDICDYDQSDLNPDRDLNKWFMYKNNQIQNDNFVGPLMLGYTSNTQHPTHQGIVMYFNKSDSQYHIDVNSPNLRSSEEATSGSAMSIYGDLDVHGNINLIGNKTYKINGIDVSPTAIQDAQNNDTNLEDETGTTNGLNDVVISGNKIAMVPKKTMAIGHLDQHFANYLKKIGNVETYTTPLTVYQNSSSSQVCNFMTHYDTNITNYSKMELGLFDATNASIGEDYTSPDYTGVKKNSIQFKVFNYGKQTTEEPTKTAFDISSYNIQTRQHNKMLSIYHDGYTNYVNIGMQNEMHGMNSNISLHVENPSKYLLQLTNNTRDPSISLHRNTGSINKFWTIDGPTEEDKLIFKNSRSTNSYTPDETTTKNVLTMTPNSIGLNVDNPSHTFELCSGNDISSMKLRNKYSSYNMSLITSSSIIQSSNLYHTYTPFQLVDDIYRGGIQYNIDNTNIPITLDQEFNYNIYKFNTSEIAIYDTKEINSLVSVVVDNIFDNFTCNNEHLYMNISNLETKINQISAESSNSINISNQVFIFPEIYQSEFCVNTIADASTEVQSHTMNIEVSDTIGRKYNYNYMYDVSLVDGFSLTDEITSEIFEKDNILYTSNLIKINMGAVNDSFIETTITDEVDCVANIKNKIFTSNVLYFDSMQTYDIDILSTIQREYRFQSDIIVPDAICKQNANRIFTCNIDSFAVDENVNKNVIMTSVTDFLNEDSDNVVETFLSTESLKIVTNEVVNAIGNRNIILNIDMFDKYGIFKTGDDKLVTDYNIQINYYDISSINYQPHIVLHNDIKYTDSDETSKYGSVNKIYSKNGSVEIVRDDNIYTTPLLNISNNGDVDMYGNLRVSGNIYANKTAGGLLSVKNLQLYGDIYDRLGNSMLLNYSEDMYNQAFIMQSSNYILYTSNYSINSTSNISFTLEGESDVGFTIEKQTSNENRYDLFTINDGIHPVITIRGGGAGANIGILKEPSINYDMDIANKLRANEIESSNIVINGDLFVYGNIETFGNVVAWDTTQADGLQSLKIEGLSESTYLEIKRDGKSSSTKYVEIVNITEQSTTTEENGEQITQISEVVSDIFTIDANGRVGILDTPSEGTDVALTVGGPVSATLFIGKGIGLTDVNLSDRDTDDLKEGLIRRYYTDDRVLGVINPIDSNMSNYVREVASDTKNTILDSIVMHFHEVSDLSVDFVMRDISKIPYKHSYLSDKLCKSIEVSIYSETASMKALVFSGTVIVSYTKDTKIFEFLNYHTYYSYYFLNDPDNNITVDGNRITIFGSSLEFIEDQLKITLDKPEGSQTTMTILSK